MKYDVTLASYVICGSHPATLGPIPGTFQKVVLDTESGAGKEIWHGYLQMREQQKKTGVKVGWPFAGIEQTEKVTEIRKFAEAINLFFRFMAGEGRDNCHRVHTITEAKPANPAKTKLEKCDWCSVLTPFPELHDITTCGDWWTICTRCKSKIKTDAEIEHERIRLRGLSRLPASERALG